VPPPAPKLPNKLLLAFCFYNVGVVIGVPPPPPRGAPPNKEPPVGVADVLFANKLDPALAVFPNRDDIYN